MGSRLLDRLIGLGATTTIAGNLSKGRREHPYEVWFKHGLVADQKRVDEGERIEAGPHRFVPCNVRDQAVAREVKLVQEIVVHLAAAIGGRGYIDTFPESLRASSTYGAPRIYSPGSRSSTWQGDSRLAPVAPASKASVDPGLGLIQAIE